MAEGGVEADEALAHLGVEGHHPGPTGLQGLPDALGNVGTIPQQVLQRGAVGDHEHRHAPPRHRVPHEAGQGVQVVEENRLWPDRVQEAADALTQVLQHRSELCGGKVGVYRAGRGVCPRVHDRRLGGDVGGYLKGAARGRVCAGPTQDVDLVAGLGECLGEVKRVDPAAGSAESVLV